AASAALGAAGSCSDQSHTWAPVAASYARFAGTAGDSVAQNTGRQIMQPVAVVTGASSGIGAATAAQLAGAGYHVVLAARRADRLEQAAARARERGGSAQTELLDVTDTAAVTAFARSLDRCDVLVNNAGGAIGMEDVGNADPADWQTMFDVNVLGSLHLTKALLPLLIASGDGTIVMLTSTAGFITYEGGGGYAAAKHAQHAMAGTLRLEL